MLIQYTYYANILTLSSIDLLKSSFWFYPKNTSLLSHFKSFHVFFWSPVNTALLLSRQNKESFKSKTKYHKQPSKI